MFRTKSEIWEETKGKEWEGKGEGWEGKGEGWEGKGLVEEWEGKGEGWVREGEGVYLGPEGGIGEFLPHQLDNPPPPGKGRFYQNYP